MDTSQDGVGIWRLEKSFGSNGPGKLTYGRGIAILPNGDMVVTDCRSLAGGDDTQNVYIYNHNGRFKSAFYVPGNPFHILFKNNHLYIINYSKYVYVYDMDGNHLRQFTTNPPELEAETIAAPPDRSTGGTSWSIFNYLWRFLSSVWYGSPARNSEDDKLRLPAYCGPGYCGSLYSIAIDNDDNLLLGDYCYRYIHKHKLDGSPITQFKIDIFPYQICVAPNGKIIISDYGIRTGVSIFDSDGIYLQTLKPPEDFTWDHPLGMCCTSDNQLYIGSTGSILSFAVDTGAFIRRVNGGEVVDPCCLTLMGGEQRLAVVEQVTVSPPCSQVKIFKWVK